MKKILLFLFPICVIAQSNYLALSEDNQFNSFGTIIEIDNDVPQTIHTFSDNGSEPYDYLVEINNKLYGVADRYGALNGGMIYEYDYVNETFEVLTHFSPIGTDAYFNNLCTGNGKIYGIKTDFFSGKNIIEYDPITQTTTNLVSLGSHGINDDIKDLVFTNNKIYGVTDFNGTNVTNTLFSYDINTNTFATEFTFNTTDGVFCHSLMLHSNGNIYGATTSGGANNYGVIFEFDTINSSYNILHHCDATERADNLVEGTGNMLYGYTTSQVGGTGRIYGFDLNTNTFTNLHYFPSSITPQGNDATFRDFYPPVFYNNTIYGVTGITGNTGIVFEYDLTNSTFNYTNAKYPSSAMYKTITNELYFSSKQETYTGALLKYDANSQTVVLANGTEFGTEGKNPRKLLKASTGIIYGTTGEASLHTYEDRLFEFDPDTGVYNVLINFAEHPNYGNTPVNLIETTNGLIYIYTLFGAPVSEQGTLIEYDPNTGNHQLAHEFSDLYDSNTAIAEDLQLFEKDNIIYGVKRWGGNNVLFKGTIFSYNTLTHTYTVLYESDDLTNTIASILTSQGIIYGVTYSGGTNGQGYLYAYNTQSNQFSVIENITSASASDFVELDNGDVYGVLQNSHGVDGSVFKIDGTTGAFSIHYEFDEATKNTGKRPYKMYTTNDNLYILTEVTTGDSNVFEQNLLEFNLTSSTPTIIHNESALGVVPIKSDMYVMNDGRLLGRTHARLFSFEQGNTAIETVFNFDTDTETVFSIIDLNDAPLSTDDFESDTKISVYPNPTTDYLHIQSNNTIKSIEIYSLQGQKIATFNNQKSIEVKHLNSGMYFLKIIDKRNRSHSMKFIKK